MSSALAPPGDKPVLVFDKSAPAGGQALKMRGASSSK